MRCSQKVYYDKKSESYHINYGDFARNETVCGGKFIMSVDIVMNNNTIKLVASGYCEKCGGEFDGYKPIDEMLTKFVEEME